MVPKILKVTRKRQLQSVQSYFIGCVFALLLLFIFGFMLGNIIVFSLWLFLDGVLVLMIHYHYLILNKEIQVEVSNQYIELKCKGNVIRLHPDDIKHLTFYLTPSRKKGSKMEFLGIESYYYARIVTTQNESYILTSLLSENLRFVLSSTSFRSKITEEKVLMAFRRSHFASNN